MVPIVLVNWRHVCELTIFFFSILTGGHFFIAFRERGRKRGREREKHRSVASHASPDWGSKPQPRCVHHLETEPETLQLQNDTPTN